MENQFNSNANLGFVPTWSLEAFQNASASCLAAMKHSKDMQSEWQNFMKLRLEKDGHYPEKIMSCKNPADFLQAQFSFVNDFFVDYTEEMQRMGKIMREATAESLHAAQNNTVTSKPVM